LKNNFHTVVYTFSRYICQIFRLVFEKKKIFVSKPASYVKKEENYIKELENKIKELEESTSQKVMERDINQLTDSETSMETGISEMAEESFTPVKTFATSPMEIGASEEIPVSSEEEMELLASGDEEELPESKSVADLRQWLGLCSPSEEIPEIVIVSFEEEELPEFNNVEELKQ
jgi:hypothetical protein